jgi:hypothetical protein
VLPGAILYLSRRVQWIACAAICLSTPALAADPYLTAEIPGVQQGDIVEVPGIIVSDGVPTRLREVHSKANIEELFTYFYRHFQEVGLYIPREADQPHMVRGYVLTGVETQSLTTYTVILQPLPDGSTTCILGSALPSMKEKPKSDSDPVPLYPGAQTPLRTRSEGQLVMTYLVEAKPEQVNSFYAETLTKGGYSQLQPDLYRGNGREVTVFTKPTPKGLTGVTLTVRDRIVEEDAAPKRAPKH